MNTPTIPPSKEKEKIQGDMQRRTALPKPLPTMEEIRRQIGWDLLATVNKSKNLDW
jgi:hypothetical protein